MTLTNRDITQSMSRYFNYTTFVNDINFKIVFLKFIEESTHLKRTKLKHALYYQ